MTQNLRLAFKSNRYLKCVFNAVAIKVSAIAEKYPGGLDSFVQKHPVRCNRHIAVESCMGDDIEETMNDLLNNGMEIGEDFTFIAAGYDAIWIEAAKHLKIETGPIKIDLGVNWLKGVYHAGGLLVT